MEFNKSAVVFRRVQLTANEHRTLNAVPLGSLVKTVARPKRDLGERITLHPVETFHICDRSRDDPIFPPDLMVVRSVIPTFVINHPSFIHRQTSLPNIPPDRYDAKLFTERNWYHPEWNPEGSPYEYPIHYTVLELFLNLTKKWCDIHGEVHILAAAIEQMKKWLSASGCIRAQSKTT